MENAQAGTVALVGFCDRSSAGIRECCPPSSLSHASLKPSCNATNPCGKNSLPVHPTNRAGSLLCLHPAPAMKEIAREAVTLSPAQGQSPKPAAREYDDMI
jgi:hypothetical protein